MIPSKIYKIVIIGGGPAAMGAIKYYDGSKDDLLLISNDEIGFFVYNSIKTHKTTDGLFFADNKSPDYLIKEYKKLLFEKKINILKDFVKKINKCDNYFEIIGSKKVYAEFVIVCTGMNYKMLNDFNKFKNVYNLAGTFNNLKNKNCVVIGGRNSGTSAAIYLAKISKKVYLLEKNNKLPCKKKYFDRLLNCKNVDFFCGVKNIKIFSHKNLNISKLKFFFDKDSKEINVDFIFIYIGLIPNSNIVKSICKLDVNDYILINSKNETSCKNLFAAGDVTGKLSQIITYHGDGANAIYWIQKRM
jgi:thioredoxin reductase (NADPH)